jgi:hypothetical protein
MVPNILFLLLLFFFFLFACAYVRRSPRRVCDTLLIAQAEAEGGLRVLSLSPTEGTLSLLSFASFAPDSISLSLGWNNGMIHRYCSDSCLQRKTMPTSSVIHHLLSSVTIIVSCPSGRYRIERCPYLVPGRHISTKCGSPRSTPTSLPRYVVHPSFSIFLSCELLPDILRLGRL